MVKIISLTSFLSKSIVEYSSHKETALSDCILTGQREVESRVIEALRSLKPKIEEDELGLKCKWRIAILSGDEIKELFQYLKERSAKGDKMASCLIEKLNST